MCEVTTLLLNIVMDRMKGKREAELDDAESGFGQGKWTRVGLLNLRLVCERHLEVQKDVYICFLDYEKGFDRVRHEPLLQCLSDIGVDGKYIQIIRDVYWDQTACCISHSFQFIHGKDFQTYCQYEGCQHGRHKLQQS